MEVGRAAEDIANLERGGLLALDADGVDGVDHLDAGHGAEFAHESQGVIEVAAQGDDFRAVHPGLGEFARGDLAVGQQHDATQSRAACVGGSGGGGVARAGANDELALVRDGLGHRRRHAAVLEGAGGVEAFVLEIELEAAARLRRQSRRGNERGGALLQA